MYNLIGTGHSVHVRHHSRGTRSRWLLLRAGVILGSVVAGGLPTRMVAQTTSPASQEIIPFWDKLGDPALAQLIREALAANPDVRAAAARIAGARAQQRLAGLDFAPAVTSAASYTRERLSAAEAPGVSFALRNTRLWSAGIDATWEIDLFGRIRHNYQGQGELVASASEDLRFVQVSLAADLATAYFQLRGDQEQLAVAQRNGANQQRNLELTQERLNAGSGTAFDTERAQAQLSTTLAAIPLLTSEITSDQNLISTLLGRESFTEDGHVAASATTSTTVPSFPATLSLAPSVDLVRSRPDVIAAERLLAAQSSFVAAARADYLPRLTFGGSVGTSGTAFDSLGKANASRYLIGPAISWPFLDLGRTKARVDASRANQEEARQAYRSTLLRASSEVSNALSAYIGAQARLANLADAATASEQAATLARLRFTEGVSDFLQVLDAERTQLDAELQLTMARTQVAVAFATVYRAAGGSLSQR